MHSREPLKIPEKRLEEIRNAILEKGTAIARHFPWKETKDPYKIWLFEVILQQTRTEQGLPYYLRITDKYPDVAALASVEEEVFLKDWEGLGYYSRARNLLQAARYIHQHLEGIFPSDYEGIRALQGVGPYTAAAIASFAFGLPYPVVDGNVLRLFSRLFGLDTPVDVQATQKRIRHWASILIQGSDPSIFNQAIMDIGALVCTPKQPRCAECSLESFCTARTENLIDLLPVKKRTLKKKELFFNYFFITDEEGRFAMIQRDSGSFWKRMYQFPLIRDEGNFSRIELLRQKLKEYWGIQGGALSLLTTGKQSLSHRHIHSRLFYAGRISNDCWPPGWIATRFEELSTRPLPRLIRDFIRKLDIPSPANGDESGVT